MIRLFIALLLFSGCAKTNVPCWDCERGRVNGVNYSDTTICQQEMPEFKDPQGNIISSFCKKK